MTKKQTFDLFAGTLVVTMAGFFLWHFIMIATHGSWTITEPNPFIMWGEIGMFGCILGFGIYFIIRMCIKKGVV